MNNNPGVNEVIALLSALKSAVRDFAAREAKLTNDFRTQTDAAERLSDEAAAKNSEKLGDAVDAENAAFAERKQRHQANYANRKARINRAHAAVRKRALDEIGEQHGQLRYNIQASTLEAERRRDEALAGTAATLENFRQATADSAGVLDDLENFARRAFGGCRKFRRFLSPGRKWPDPDLSPDENQLFERQQKLQEKFRSDLKRYRRLPLPLVFRFLPVWLVMLALLAAVTGLILAQYQIRTFSQPNLGIAIVALAIVLAAYFVGTRGATPLAKTIAGDLAAARRLLDAAAEKAELRYQQDQGRIRAEYEAAINNLDQEWRAAEKGVIRLRGARPVSIDEQAARLFQKHEQLHRASGERIRKEHEENLKQLREQSETEATTFSESQAAKLAKLKSNYQSSWLDLEAEWKSTIQPLDEKIHAAIAVAEKDFPDWNSDAWKNWTPPNEFKNAAKFGRLEVDLAKFAETLPKDERLALPLANFSAPLSLAFPLEGSILFETNKGGETEAITGINNIIFRLLSTTPPGKFSFTIFDPVGLGQNFAGAHAPGRLRGKPHQQPHLDAAGAIRGKARRAERAHGEGHPDVSAQRIRDHRGIQRAGRQHRGEISFPRHRVDFPVNFSDTAARRLRNIATSGARCGVYTLDPLGPPPRAAA